MKSCINCYKPEICRDYIEIADKIYLVNLSTGRRATIDDIENDELTGYSEVMIELAHSRALLCHDYKELRS